MKLIILLSLLVNAVDAAEPSTEVSFKGTVVDVENHLPISSAQIHVEKYRGGATFDLSTDSSGVFEIVLKEPGHYMADIKADGYLSPHIFSTTRVIKVEPNSRKTQQRTFQLSRPSTVSGQLIDSVTRLPLADFNLDGIEVHYSKGEVQFLPTQPAKTNAKGEFRFEGLPPAEYVLEIYKESKVGVIAGTQPEYTKGNPRPVGYG